jgi:hypothetical protein
VPTRYGWGNWDGTENAVTPNRRRFSDGLPHYGVKRFPSRYENNVDTWLMGAGNGFAQKQPIFLDDRLLDPPAAWEVEEVGFGSEHVPVPRLLRLLSRLECVSHFAAQWIKPGYLPFPGTTVRW